MDKYIEVSRHLASVRKCHQYALSVVELTSGDLEQLL